MTWTPPARRIAVLITQLRAAGCVFAEDEAALLVEAADDAAHLDALTARRVRGEPLEHLLGWVQFAGRRLPVRPGVFVPRRRSELLVREAVASGGRLIVDLCCGGGAIGVSVAAALPDSTLWCCDLDPAAVDCATEAIRQVGVSGRALVGDLDAPLPADLAGRVDLLTANAPYVPRERIRMMPPEARDHEPLLALDGGTDGLDLHRRIAAVAPRWLRRGGHVLIETSPQQAPDTASACAAAGLDPRISSDPDLGATIVVARMPPH